MSDPLILAFDPGQTTGYATYCPVRRLATCYSQSFRGYKHIGALVSDYRQWVRDLIEGWRPALIVSEQPIGKFVSQPTIAQHAAAWSIAHEAGITFWQGRASAARQHLGLKARTTDAQVIEAVRAFGFEPESGHAADAAALAIHAAVEWAKERAA